jgi:hypothetical protein
VAQGAWLAGVHANYGSLASGGGEHPVARWWTEPLDTKRHRDFISTSHIGGMEIEPPRDRLIEQRVYFVEAAGFTFQFVSLGQLRETLGYFEQQIHPSSRKPGVVLEHYWQSWFERLPQWLFEEPRRVKVVSALNRALQAFEAGAREP